MLSSKGGIMSALAAAALGGLMSNPIPSPNLMAIANGRKTRIRAKGPGRPAGSKLARMAREHRISISRIK